MIEHELARSFVVSAGYIRSRGHRLYRYVNDNRMGSGIYLGRPDERLYNLSSGFVTINNQSRSSYDGFQLRFESSSLRNLGLEFGANYTWSHSLDNASSLLGDEAQAGSGLFPLDAFNPQLDKGSSDFDLRHRMIAHASWLIPFGGGRSGWPKQILHGWELEGIFSTQSGLPFGLRDGRVPDREIGDTSRPLVSGTPPTPMPGSSQVPDTKTPNSFLFLPLNPIRDMEGNCLPNSIPFSCLPSVNGPFTGALGRNVYHRPGVIWTNLALVKNFGLAGFRGRERFNLQVRAEFYNFFNHSNLYIKTDSTNLAFSSFNSVSGSVPGVVVSYGTPERGPQEARQVVLAIKLVF
jgi:hypothetical protein